MGCNCGRRRVIRQQAPVTSNVGQQAETLVADAQVREIDLTDNRTDPATGVVQSHNGSVGK